MSGQASWLFRWAQCGLQLAALLLAATLPALFDHGYRLRDFEPLVIGAGAVVCGFLLSACLLKLPRVERVLFAVLAVFVLDVYFLGAWPWVLLTAAAIIGIHFTRFEADWRNVASVFALIFVALAAQTSSRPLLEPALSDSPQRTVGTAAQDKPLILHIVLDEQGSPQTASAPMRSSGRLDRLLASYVERGFLAHESVRAMSGATQVSLSRVFGPQNIAPKQSNVSSLASPFSNRLRKNDLLNELAQRGYAVSVIQNTFLQLCADNAASCHTYQRANSGHAMGRFRNMPASRLWLAGALLHLDFLDMQGDRGALLYGFLARWAMKIGLGYVVHDRHYWARPAAVLEVLDNLEHRAETMRKGEAWVVHLLLPHFPYVLDGKCGLRNHQDWSVPAWVSESEPEQALLTRVESDYWQQVECVHARVLAVVDQLDNTLGRENVRVLIHGDHGARLATKQAEPDAGQLAMSEPNGSLDTLLLVRAPTLVPGVSPDRVPLVETVRQSYGLLMQ